jgi:ATP synthase protein I
MVMVSATERPQGERDDEQPELVLRDAPEPGHRAGPGLAARRHKTWESRFKAGQGDNPGPLAGHGAGWEVFSYLIAGMLAYGGIGWVIGHFTHVQILFPIGMLVGLAISLGWIVHKYGRQK